MKKIAFFCIPAHGHTNPMLPVASELVKRGDNVRFYSFSEFEKKIRATGAEFISCDSYLPELSQEEEKKIKSVSVTEMSIQDIRITLAMDSFLDDEFKSFKPDVVYTDSACFWGKLNAIKHNVPIVVSTSTFAFNQMSSQYMKSKPSELADMILGLPRASKELKKLEPYGYHVKSYLSLVRNDNDTDTVVYTSRYFQPYEETFNSRYAFVGPSVFSNKKPDKKKERPLVYISMGTVINDRPDFYSKCIDALKGENVDVIISCGRSVDLSSFGALPDNIKVYPYVDQLDILSSADVFITHCGMNSVSESLYMAAPMVLYPQTNEQYAVAARTKEIGAGVMLTDDSANGIRTAVNEILANSDYANAAIKCSNNFRSCTGAKGAADHIENAPHSCDDVNIIDTINKASSKFQAIYWALIIAMIVLIVLVFHWKYVWIIGVAAGIISIPISKAYTKKKYEKLAAAYRSKE